MTPVPIFWLFAVAEVTNLEHPLKLVTEDTDTGVKVLIVGSSNVACAVEYELEVQSGGVGNANRSVQRGTARLMPNQKITVAKTSLRLTAPVTWNARLLVQTCEGTNYEMTSSSKQ